MDGGERRKGSTRPREESQTKREEVDQKSTRELKENIAKMTELHGDPKQQKGREAQSLGWRSLGEGVGREELGGTFGTE